MQVASFIHPWLPQQPRKEVCDDYVAHPALVLNADFRPMSYFPLSLLSWQDAVSAVFSERVSVVAEYDAWARSPSTRIRLPSVVALRKYQRAPRRVAFTRFNVFLRDRFTCQYCGEPFASSALTFEHVDPALARRPDDVVEHRDGVRARATPARATRCASSRDACRRSRRSTSCWLPSARFRPAICTRAGRTTSTGTRSSRPRHRLVAQWIRAPPSEGGGRAFKSRRNVQQGRLRWSGRQPVLKTGGHREVWRSNRQPSANTGAGDLAIAPHRSTHRYSSGNEA